MPCPFSCPVASPTNTRSDGDAPENTKLVFAPAPAPPFCPAGLNVVSATSMYEIPPPPTQDPVPPITVCISRGVVS